MSKLTPAERRAIECLGRRRKSDVKVGRNRPISRRIFNQLQQKKLVMWLDKQRCIAMLTANGEREWARMHPHSKYRIS